MMVVMRIARLIGYLRMLSTLLRDLVDNCERLVIGSLVDHIQLVSPLRYCDLSTGLVHTLMSTFSAACTHRLLFGAVGTTTPTSLASYWTDEIVV